MELAFHLFYDSFYQECAADAMVNRWQYLDEVVKVLVALTATGSAVSGWALWQSPSFRSVWAVIAGVGAMLAIIHTALGVSGRLREWGHIKRYFTDLRYDLETFAAGMELDENVAVELCRAEVMRCYDRLKEGIELVRNDILFTGRLGKKVQRGLDERLNEDLQAMQKPVPVPHGIEVFRLGLTRAKRRGSAAREPGKQAEPDPECES
jgi:hypothetical protein